MIIRVEKTKNYSVVSNHGLENATLSLKAIGMYAYLLSRPDDWNITERGLASVLKDGRDAIRGALKELEDAGYLIRVTSKGTDGRYSTTTTLYEQPNMVGKDLVGKPDQVAPKPKATKKNKGDLVGLSRHGKPSHLISTDKTSTTSTSVEEPEAEEFGNPTINKMIEIFEEANGTKLRLIARQRRMAQHIIRRAGSEEKAIGLCHAAIACRDDRFAPNIGNLMDLHEKLDNLAVYYRKRNNSAKVAVGVVQ